MKPPRCPPRKLGGEPVMKRIYKSKYRLETIAVLVLGISFIAFGVWRNEISVVLAKGINLCLECVGIG